jgi:hypothetical protein
LRDPKDLCEHLATSVPLQLPEHEHKRREWQSLRDLEQRIHGRLSCPLLTVLQVLDHNTDHARDLSLSLVLIHNPYDVQHSREKVRSDLGSVFVCLVNDLALDGWKQLGSNRVAVCCQVAVVGIREFQLGAQKLAVQRVVLRQLS